MRRKGPQRDAEKERFWREVIRRQERSGRSVRGFCRDEALSEPSFHAWRRELKQRDDKRQAERAQRDGKRQAEQAQRDGKRQIGLSQRRPARRPAFVAVQLVAGTGLMTAGAIELALPNGAVLKLPPNIEPATVASIINAWERERC
jgi:hypothetical protein